MTDLSDVLKSQDKGVVSSKAMCCVQNRFIRRTFYENQAQNLYVDEFDMENLMNASMNIVDLIFFFRTNLVESRQKENYGKQ